MPPFVQGIWKPLLAFTLFLSAITSGGYLVFHRYKEIITAEKQNELGGIADLKIRQISTWMAERKGDAQALKDDPLFAQTLDAWLRRGAAGDAGGAMLSARLASMQQAHAAYGYTSVALYDNRARLRLSILAHEPPITAEEKAMLLESMRGGQIIFSDIRRKQIDGRDATEIDLVTPLFAGENGARQAIGAVRLRMDAKRFLFPLIQRWPTPSASAENLLVRREGERVLFLNELRHRKNGELVASLPLSPQLPAAMAVRGREGLVEGVDYRGVVVVGVLNRIPDTSWYMVSKIDQAELYAPIERLWKWMLFLMVLLVVAGGTLVYFWRARDKKQMLSEFYRRRLTQKLDHLTRYANDIILLTDERGAIIEFNDRALEAYGYSAPEFARMNEADLRARESFAPATDDFKAGAARFETEHVRRDGEIFPVEISMRRVTIDGKVYFQSITRDISERKQGEADLRKTNRALGLLSQCNAALAHAEEEVQLSEICKLIVELGGYRMAWVGYAQDDPGKTVRPVMRHGFSDHYLDETEITWADAGRACDPAGAAIAGGTIQIWQNLLLEPAATPWRDAVLARGYRSCIALPLWDESRVFGALGVYSTGAQAFDADEVLLLQELANILEYGIMTQRLRAERAQAVAQFKNEHSRMRTLVQTIPDMVWLKNPDGVYLACNPQFERFFGAKEAQIIGKTDFDFVEAELAEFFRGNDWTAIAAGKPTSNEEWLTYPDSGQRVLMETIKTPVLDAAGELVGVMGIARDITERKHAEERESRLRHVLNNTLDMIFIFLPKSLRFVYMNKGAVNSVGYSIDQLLLMGPPDLMPLLDEAAFRRFVAPLVRGEKAMLRFETLLRHEDGSDLPVEVQLQLVQEENGESLYVAVVRDISERRRAEKELQRQKTFMRQVIDIDPNQIFVRDAQGNFLLANHGAAAQHGLTPQQMVGKNLAEVGGSAAEVAECLREDRRVVEEGGEISRVAPYSLPGGGLRWMLSLKKRLVMPDGKPAVLGIEVDITRQKLSELKLAESYEQLQQLTLHLETVRAEERAKIALNLHDEMGATLAAMKMRVAWLASRLPGALPELAEEVEQIDELVAGGIRTMRQIVSELKPSQMHDDGLLLTVENYLKKFMRDTKIECALIAPEQELRLDSGQTATLFRILQESLNNVAKHAGANRVVVTLAPENGSLLMSIEDNGSGFDPAQRDPLSFGLLGIRERALMLGGYAEIVSRPGAGTRVAVRIPLNPARRPT